jgi:hypothetical protein
MIKRLKSDKGRQTYGERMCSVEPVFGSLQQHYGLRWMNVRGKRNAQKVMLMCTVAFYLKKWVRQWFKNMNWFTDLYYKQLEALMRFDRFLETENSVL